MWPDQGKPPQKGGKRRKRNAPARRSPSSGPPAKRVWVPPNPKKKGSRLLPFEDQHPCLRHGGTGLRGVELLVLTGKKKGRHPSDEERAFTASSTRARSCQASGKKRKNEGEKTRLGGVELRLPPALGGGGASASDAKTEKKRRTTKNAPAARPPSRLLAGTEKRGNPSQKKNPRPSCQPPGQAPSWQQEKNRTTRVRALDRPPARSTRRHSTPDRRKKKPLPPDNDPNVLSAGALRLLAEEAKTLKKNRNAHLAQPGPPGLVLRRKKRAWFCKEKKHSLSAIHHREGRARALLMLLWMLLLMLLWMLLLMQLLMLLLMPKTLPRYPKPCPATRSLAPLPEALSRYPKPCPATRNLAPLPEALSRYPKPCPATRSLVPLPETSLALYPKPCPATRSLVPLPETLPRYPKPCPATRNFAPLPEALPETLPETLPRYPKPCRYPSQCCCWCCCARALPANQVRLRHSLLAKKHQTGLRHASTPEEVFPLVPLSRTQIFNE